MLVIGITGKNSAGKDSIADILADRGFERLSLSDVLREELRRRQVAITRRSLIDLGVQLRDAEGPSVLAERVKGMMRSDRVCLVSVRSPAEVEALRRLARFVLLRVEAPLDVRFERERRRGREGAPETLDGFLALEARENTDDENAQQLDATLSLADETIRNDGTKDDLRRRVLALLERLDG